VSFRRHIDLAKRLGKVLQIHDRDAHADVLRILAEEGAPERTVFHCFSGDADMARFCAERGWYLSFAGTLTFRNAGALRDALRAVPLERVLVETDAPYLTPAPFRGRPNASYLVPLTVRCMANVLGRELDDVCARLNATSEELYGEW
jgi:TatD DNase family protein